ncbi:MAG: hypothetical protein M3Y40_01885 [Chloroflexota bacterium]|nr:hypothetical protein [Chloroflexota bacterium]
MNMRVFGCIGLAAAAFVIVAAFAVYRAGAPAECPTSLPYEPASFNPVGEITDEPHLEGVTDPLVESGGITFGLATWRVWIEPDRAPIPTGEPLPQRIVLECGDGTFQAYQRGTG